MTESARERWLRYYAMAHLHEDPHARDWRSNPINWYRMHPDYAARLIVMSATVWYRFKSPIISEADDLKLVRYVLEDGNYQALTKLKQWQLGDPAVFSESTRQVRVTTMAYRGALDWHARCTGIELHYPEPLWRQDTEQQCRYIYASDPI
jgi:hypothetical protein